MSTTGLGPARCGDRCCWTKERDWRGCSNGGRSVRHRATNKRGCFGPPRALAAQGYWDNRGELWKKPGVSSVGEALLMDNHTSFSHLPHHEEFLGCRRSDLSIALANLRHSMFLWTLRAHAVLRCLDRHSQSIARRPMQLECLESSLTRRATTYCDLSFGQIIHDARYGGRDAAKRIPRQVSNDCVNGVPVRVNTQAFGEAEVIRQGLDDAVLSDGAFLRRRLNEGFESPLPKPAATARILAAKPTAT